MRTFNQLLTERLLLRRWQDVDREPFALMNADPRVRRYFPGLRDRADSDGDVAVFEERFARNGFGLWALQRRAEGDFIGFTGLNPVPDGVPRAGGWEIGWGWTSCGR